MCINQSTDTMKILRDSILTIDHGILNNKSIDLKHSKVLEYRPTELHHIADGSINDKPSFVIALEHPDVETVIYGQVSLEMLTKALDQCGYELKPKTDSIEWIPGTGKTTPNLWKVIGVDNFDRETVSDRPMHTLQNLSKKRAQEAADNLNRQSGEHSDWFYKVVPQDHKLYDASSLHL